MIALYSRVSTEIQKENYSIGEQQERMQKYCDAMKWTAYKFYTDAGFSGAKLDRPALQKLIRDVRSGKIERVLVYKLDRLSRSQKDILYLIEDVFLANKCEFVSITENLDTSSAFGKAMTGILAVFAQLEREQIRERMAIGRDARAKSGKFCGCYVPLGYDRINDELVTNEFEKLQIIQIFENYASGMSPTTIAKKLNNAGMTHKYGKWWNKTIRTILTKKTYLGYISYHGEWIKGSHEAFIDEELFNRVQKILAQKSADNLVHNRRAGKASSYLAGFLYCAHCGAKYGKVKYSHYNYKCYSRMKKNYDLIRDPNCKNLTWRMDELDDLVFGEVRKLLIDTESLSFDEIPTSDDKTVMVRQIDTLNKKIEKLMDLYVDGKVPLNILEEKVNSLNDQRALLEDELEQAEQNAKDQLTLQDVKRMSASFSDILDNGSFDEIRTVLSELIEKIEIDGENITIFWRFS